VEDIVDYLEMMEEESSDALWQAEQTLGGETAGRRRGTADGEAEEMEDRGSISRPGEKPGETRPGRTAEEWKEPEKKMLRLPLLAASEALERAVEGIGMVRTASLEGHKSGGEGVQGARGRKNAGAVFQSEEVSRRTLEGRGERTEAPGSGAAAGRGVAWQRAADQAELLDQVFRRDSRRYDGGFFLY